MRGTKFYHLSSPSSFWSGRVEPSRVARWLLQATLRDSTPFKKASTHHPQEHQSTDSSMVDAVLSAKH